MGKMTIWYDQQGDFLEIGIGKHKGYFKDIGNDVWERVDKNGKVFGIAIANFKRRLSKMKSEVTLPLEIAFRG